MNPQNQNTYKYIKHINMYLYTLSCEYKMIQQFWEIVGQFLIRLNIQLPYNSSNTLLDIHPQRNEYFDPYKDMYMNIHNSFIFNSQNWKKYPSIVE